jgi:hypothetical protein
MPTEVSPRLRKASADGARVCKAVSRLGILKICRELAGAGEGRREAERRFLGRAQCRVDFRGAPKTSSLRKWVDDQLPAIRFESPEMTWELYQDKLKAMQGIVETFVDGREKRSPSVQIRIDPLGGVEPISTHDQVLGGPNAPANPVWSVAL